MKIDISSIVNISGASLKIELDAVLEGLNSIDEVFSFNSPIRFKGELQNESGILKLSGRLETEYAVECYRCLRPIENEVDIKIEEDFVNAENTTDTERYTFEGNFITLDKVFKDNIVLNLPARQACSKDCKGICARCGTDLNVNSCDCKEEVINPQMDALKKFFNK